jgi:hypothetical protein
VINLFNTQPIRGFGRSDGKRKIVRLLHSYYHKSEQTAVEAAARSVGREKPNKGILDRSIKDVQNSRLINP